MENENNLSESIICTGSDMNHRTFRDDESWNSLQSTILAGQFSMSTESSPQEDKNNLTTLNEETSSKEEMEFKSIDDDENMLNMNLDAISDDDVFFDCRNVSSPTVPNKSNQVVRNETSPKINGMTSQQKFLTVNSQISANNESTADSGVEDEKTGALLVQIVEDFKDMKDHAQSTPKHLSPVVDASKNLRKRISIKNNKNVATSLKMMTNVKRETKNGAATKLANCLTAKAVTRQQTPYPKQNSPIDGSNKENFFAGKYSNAVASVLCKADSNIPSPAEKKAPKVAEMREFFESQSKLYEQSRNRKIDSKIPIRKLGPKSASIAKSPQARSLRSPSYHTQETFKLIKTSKAIKASGAKGALVNGSGTSSFLIRNQAHNLNRARPSSCSEYAAEAPCHCQVSKNTSKSTGDLSKDCVKHSKLWHATERKMINKRPNQGLSQCVTLNQKSPSALKVSDIMKRKSLGYVSSPVKPVKELRKIFSPSRDLINVNQANKRAYKKTPAIKIVLSND